MVVLSVPNLKALKALQNHKDGEVIRVEELDQDYCYVEETDEWVPFFSEVDTTEVEGEVPGLDLYSVNKMLINQLPDLDEEDIDKVKKIIRKYVDTDSKGSSSVYMLLCHELRYYTIFLKDETYKENLEDVVIECLEYFGKIKDIDYNEDSNAIEIWFVTDNEPFVAYLFNYNEGVVLCQ